SGSRVANTDLFPRNRSRSSSSEGPRTDAVLARSHRSVDPTERQRQKRVPCYPLLAIDSKLRCRRTSTLSFGSFNGPAARVIPSPETKISNQRLISDRVAGRS